MLIPRFTLSQTNDEVQVIIKLPYVRVGDAEVVVDGRNFSFYCKPYLLKLTFPEELKGNEEEENCRAVYDAEQDKGTMTLHLKKKDAGVDFKDLDLTTSLLQPISTFGLKPGGRADGVNANAPPAIEVLHSESFLPQEDAEAEAEEEADHASRRSKEVAGVVEQEEESVVLIPSASSSYGFNRQYSGVFKHLQDELFEVIHLPDPEVTPETKRTQLREEKEQQDFDGDRYLGDLCEAAEDPLYEEAMQMTAFWEQAVDGQGSMNDEERDELVSLKNKEFLIDDKLPIMLGLVDLLLAFAYDHRTTSGEPTVESCWTLTTLSPSLCWLQTYATTQQLNSETVIRAFLRRSLTYPYLRVWALSQRVIKDVEIILSQGRRTILRCLLRMRRTLRRTETHYLLNRIFLDDYCVFIQQTLDASIGSLAEDFKKACQRINKGCLGLGLVELEALLEEEEEEEEGPSEDNTSESDRDSDEDSDDDDDEEEEEEEEDRIQSVVEIKEREDVVTQLASLSLQTREHGAASRREEGEGKRRDLLESPKGASPETLISRLTCIDNTSPQEQECKEKQSIAKKKVLIQEL